jgi:hypothetical protein
MTVSHGTKRGEIKLQVKKKKCPWNWGGGCRSINSGNNRRQRGKATEQYFYILNSEIKLCYQKDLIIEAKALQKGFTCHLLGVPSMWKPSLKIHRTHPQKHPRQFKQVFLSPILPTTARSCVK